MFVRSLLIVAPNLYEVQLDEEKLLLTEDTVLSFRLLKGNQVDCPISILKEADAIQKRRYQAMTYALRYQKSAQEIKAYVIERLQAGEEEAKTIIDEFKQKQIIDDLKLSQQLASALARKGNGTFLIRQKLRQRQIDAETIEQAIASIEKEEWESGKNLLLKKLEKKYQHEDAFTKKMKIKAAFYRHGYLPDE